MTGTVHIRCALPYKAAILHDKWTVMPEPIRWSVWQYAQGSRPILKGPQPPNKLNGRFGRTSSFPGEGGNVRNRRISPVAEYPDLGPLTEPAGGSTSGVGITLLGPLPARAPVRRRSRRCVGFLPWTENNCSMHHG